ncbi:MAG TPA: hypothetical protein VF762_19405 [Blastocatellia bacterium]|jgi:hypothetical protein
MIKRLDSVVIPQVGEDGNLYDQVFVTIGFFRAGEPYAQVRVYPEDAEGLLDGDHARLVGID